MNSIMVTLKVNMATTQCNYAILLFTGTDSLIYEIKTEGVYEDLRIKKCLILLTVQLSQILRLVK